jgi:predicted metal-dependent phosphoesterase TrpH
VVPGIEISAMRDGRDVHVLGYGFDPSSGPLLAFLRGQRADRVDRVRRMAARLADLGAPVDVAPLLECARRHRGRSIGRPQVARALVEAGHAASVQEAFDRYLASRRPAYVARRAVSPAEVVSLIVAARGIASLAHPGLLGRDAWIAECAGAGLAAVEAYHCDHDDAATARYRGLATALGLAVSGGSDYHGEASGRPGALGSVSLPSVDYERLLARAREAGCPCLPARPRRG